MKKRKEVRTIHIGIRKLDLIEGLTIKHYLPELILPSVHMALADRNMKWNDKLIKDCTMVISSQKYVSMIYRYNISPCKGQLLFTYCLDPAQGHRFSFAAKAKHIEVI